jgi:hypothetical protein
MATATKTQDEAAGAEALPEARPEADAAGTRAEVSRARVSRLEQAASELAQQLKSAKAQHAELLEEQGDDEEQNDGKD